MFAISFSFAFDLSSWHRFWWWTPGQSWPSKATDVLRYTFGTCREDAPYCFQRLPNWTKEDSTELLSIDSEGTVYLWKFDSKNPTAHAVWLALHDHKETVSGTIVTEQPSLEPKDIGRKETESVSGFFHVQRSEWG